MKRGRRHSRSMQMKYDNGLRPMQRASGVAPGPGSAEPAAAADAAGAEGVAAEGRPGAALAAPCSAGLAPLVFDGAAGAFETDVLDNAVHHPQVHADLIATHGIETTGVVVAALGIFLKIPRVTVMVEDHLLVQGTQVRH